VPFYQTDGMGIVHHANYAHFLEVARIQLLDEVDMPYRDYLALGLHYAVRKLDVHYKRAARYDDVIETTVWVQWVRGASLGIGYELRVDDTVIATAATEHAMVDNDGRPTRIPRERRANLTKLAASA
jgi:acyl-CoA thioester hydrolase